MEGVRKFLQSVFILPLHGGNELPRGGGGGQGGAVPPAGLRQPGPDPQRRASDLPPGRVLPERQRHAGPYGDFAGGMRGRRRGSGIGRSLAVFAPPLF